MPLEIRELTIRAIVNEDESPSKSQVNNLDNGAGQPGLDEKRILDLAMEQMAKLMKNRDER
jgi:hypothetical protein